MSRRSLQEDGTTAANAGLAVACRLKQEKRSEELGVLGREREREKSLRGADIAD